VLQKQFEDRGTIKSALGSNFAFKIGMRIYAASVRSDVKPGNIATIAGLPKSMFQMIFVGRIALSEI